jgi:hypothetical protein
LEVVEEAADLARVEVENAAAKAVGTLHQESAASTSAPIIFFFILLDDQTVSA